MGDGMQYLIEHPDLANALATIFAALTALIALVVSVWALWIQRSHNKVSVRPIPEITVADFEDSLWVKLSNNGVGPLIVKSVHVRSGQEERGSIIEWMPTLPNSRHWTNFAVVKTGRTLRAEGVLPLLELIQESGEVGFGHCRDMVRAALCQLTVVVEFTDVYGSKFPACTKSLEWFGRNLRKEA
jgi:hypothetical protein